MFFIFYSKLKFKSTDFVKRNILLTIISEILKICNVFCSSTNGDIGCDYHYMLDDNVPEMIEPFIKEDLFEVFIIHNLLQWFL